MRIVLTILFLFSVAYGQMVRINGSGIKVKLNAPGQSTVSLTTPATDAFSIYKKSDEPFVTAFDYTPDVSLTFPSTNIDFSSASVVAVPLDLKVSGSTFWHDYEKWKITLTVIMGATNAGDDGFFMGVKTDAPSNYVFGLGVEMIVANKVRIYWWNDGAKLTTIFKDMPTTYTPGDVMTFTIERNIGDMTITCTSGATTITGNYTASETQNRLSTAEFPILVQKFQLLFKQGNFTVTDLHIESNTASKNLMLGGNSITQGYGTTSTPDIWTQQIKNTYPLTTVFAGGGNNTQLFLKTLPAIILANPHEVAVELGINDINGGFSLSTLETNYASIISQLVSAGIVPVIELITPGGNANIATFNTWLRTTYSGSYRIIDFYSILKDPVASTLDTRYTFDNLHLNQDGQNIQRDAFLSQWKTTSAPTIIKAEVTNTTTVKVTFSDVVTATNTGYTFKKNGGANNPTAISGSGTNFLTFTFPSVAAADAITMSYSSGDTKDPDNNNLASISNRAVTNLITAPTIISMTLRDAHTVRVVFDQAVTTTTAGWHFGIGSYNTATSVSGSGTSTVDFTFASTAVAGNSNYTGGYESFLGDAVNSTGNPLQSFKNTNLTAF